ncbi:alpha/beta fold hydrolase [Nonomuraea salmonea]|uniref:alpha/beta fold hydrolase n=1 Tax=Nonomuraea salmonea TaxID=46181 RepID=UPI0031EAFE76
MTTTARRRRVGIAGALVGAASAGVAAAALAKRYAVGRIRLRPDTEASEPFGELRGTEHTLITSDGKALHVEIDGPERKNPSADDEPPLTVVFCHGYCLSMESWHYQRKDLRDNYRVVLWDQRSHGRSQRAGAEDSTIDRLGDDLAEVIAAHVPGPCVLVGHSMGGMTIMALADRHPPPVRRQDPGGGPHRDLGGQAGRADAGPARDAVEGRPQGRPPPRCRCWASAARSSTGPATRAATSPSSSPVTSASATRRTSARPSSTSPSR